MMGLVILGALVLYLLLSIFVVHGAIKHAKKTSKSAKRWGWGAALVMYLIPFWDWLPTVAVHQYYCATESGFWVYKTLDQWKVENPGVIENLPLRSSSPSPIRFEELENGHKKIDNYLLNPRFNWVVIQQDISRVLPIIRAEEQLKDIDRNEILARSVDFGTGNSVKDTVGPPGPVKIWMSSGHCPGGKKNRDALRMFANYFYQ